MVMNEHAVRLRAYEIWENEGRPEGTERRHWEQAVHEIASAGAADGQAAIKDAVKKMKKAAARKPALATPRRRKVAAAA